MITVNKQMGSLTIVSVDFEKRLLGSVATLKTKCGKTATYLVADAPEWVRELFFKNNS